MKPLTFWLRRLTTLPNSPRRREPGTQARRDGHRGRCLLLEVLEGRAVPSTLTVLNTDDSGAGSLRQALLDAAPGDTVAFQEGLSGTIQLSDTLTIDKSLTISGPGRDLLTVSGEGAVRDFHVAPGVGVTLSGLTMSDGFAPFGGWAANGGAIYNDGGLLTLTSCAFSDNRAEGNGNDAAGGAIYSTGGSLTVTNCAFSDNRVITSGGSLDYGGAIYSTLGPLTVTNCTFTGNSAGREGGAIAKRGLSPALISNSTFSGNSSDWYGGGIAVLGTMALTNCTFTGNYAQVNGGGLFSYSSIALTNCTFTNNASAWLGGAIGGRNLMTLTNCTVVGNWSNAGSISGDQTLGPGLAGSLRMSNTIVAKSYGYGTADLMSDIYLTSAVTSLGHNLIGIADGSSGWLASDLTGTTASPLDPLVGPLQDNGGRTQTMALLFGSPAIDAGDDTNGGLLVPATDQRGQDRIAGDHIDIGAFEAQQVTLFSGAAGADVTLEAPAGANILDAQALPAPAPEQAPEGAQFPVGAFSFTLAVAAEGATVEVVLYIPTGTVVNAYYKQNPATDNWELFAGATFEDRNGDGTNDVVMTLTDGGAGDADGQVNGSIDDPGAPAYVRPPLPVRIDVRQESINLASQGVVPVVLFGAAGFDVSRVDINSVRFAGASASQSSLADVDGDGRLDLVLHFRVQDTTLRQVYEQLLLDDHDADGVLDSTHQTAQASLAGRTQGGELFEGFDAVELFLSGRGLRELLDRLFGG